MLGSFFRLSDPRYLNSLLLLTSDHFFILISIWKPCWLFSIAFILSVPSCQYQSPLCHVWSLPGCQFLLPLMNLQQGHLQKPDADDACMVTQNYIWFALGRCSRRLMRTDTIIWLKLLFWTSPLCCPWTVIYYHCQFQGGASVVANFTYWCKWIYWWWVIISLRRILLLCVMCVLL